MQILAVDSSSPSGSVAVLRDEKVLGVISILSAEAYSSRLFRHLDFLLRDLSLRMDEFDLFAVASGPGSFTGLRVGLATAKAWAEVYQKPIAGVSVLSAVAAQCQSSSNLTIPVLDARRGEVYFSFYRQGEKGRVLCEHEQVASPTEFGRSLQSFLSGSSFTIVTPHMESLRGLFAGLGLEGNVEAASGILAPFVGKVGLELARTGGLSDSLQLDANYIRRSDAEESIGK